MLNIGRFPTRRNERRRNCWRKLWRLETSFEWKQLHHYLQLNLCDTDGEPPASVIVTAETATEQSAVAVEEPNAGIKSAVERPVVVPFRPSNDPFEWEVNDELRDYTATFGLVTQNKASSYPKSVREYSNMSGIYNGLQSKIMEENPLAQYCACSGHSLNLVGELL